MRFEQVEDTRCLVRYIGDGVYRDLEFECSIHGKMTRKAFRATGHKHDCYCRCAMANPNHVYTTALLSTKPNEPCESCTSGDHEECHKP